jgi:hypothetical protein
MRDDKWILIENLQMRKWEDIIKTYILEIDRVKWTKFAPNLIQWPGSSEQDKRRGTSAHDWQLFKAFAPWGNLIKLIILIGIVGGGVQLGPLGTTATNRPIVPAPGDYDDEEEIGGMIEGETEVLGQNLSTTNPTSCPDANPGRRGGKPATNRLSYGTAWSKLNAQMCLQFYMKYQTL